MKKLLLASLVLVCILIYFLLPSGKGNRVSQSPSLVFYCAAGIKAPVEEICAMYEDEYGVSIQLQFGGSGTLLSNIKVSQSGDLFLAADASYLDRAHDAGLVAERIPIATMQPVIAFSANRPNPIQSLDDLLRPDIEVALGNPDAAAVGIVTQKLLEKVGLWEALEAKTKVFKPTVNEIANDIKIGSVDAGIIWDTIARQYDEISYITVPTWEEERQHVAIGVLVASRNPTPALQFARYLSARDKGLPLFEKWGFTPTLGDKWEPVPEITFFSGGVNRLAIQESIREFEQREGCRFNVVYNGCGILVAQMKTGQVPDAYFACDVSFMTQVGDLFLDSTVFSETDMVVITQKENPKNISTLHDLSQPGIQLGVANAEQSALGSLTMRLLTEMGLYEAIHANVRSQTPTADLLVNQMLTGSLDAAIVYRVNTSKVQDKLHIIPIAHPSATAIQPFAIAKSTEHPFLVSRFLDKIQSRSSMERFQTAGFRVQ